MNRLRVLVVDSNGEEAQRLAARLASSNDTALPATGLQEACEALFVQKFDAVLLSSELAADAIQEFTSKLREVERGQRTTAPAAVLSISGEIPNGAAWCVGHGGIDAYVAEPFEAPVLHEALNGLTTSIPCGSEPASDAAGLPVFEIEQFRNQVAHDRSLMREIIELFLCETPPQVTELREAVAAYDFERAARIAHTIKGSLAALHAQQARYHTQQVESASKNSDTAQCREALSCLEHDLAVLGPQLLSLRDNSAGE